MKKIMKLITLVVVLTISAASFAQTFGVKAGLNLSNMLMKDNDVNYSKDLTMNPGFHVGATAEFPISGMFSFEPGLLLSTKGYKYDEKGSGYEYKETLNLLYIDIPLTAKATCNVGSVKIYGVLGPYLGLGLSGKYKFTDNEDGDITKGTDEVKWGSDADTDDLRRLDFGLVAGAGVEINSIQIGVSYELGLANISSDTGNGMKINNRVLGITLGYRFGGK
jgi:hypothetical protein